MWQGKSLCWWPEMIKFPEIVGLILVCLYRSVSVVILSVGWVGRCVSWKLHAAVGSSKIRTGMMLSTWHDCGLWHEQRGLLLVNHPSARGVGGRRWLARNKRKKKKKNVYIVISSISNSWFNLGRQKSELRRMGEGIILFFYISGMVLIPHLGNSKWWGGNYFLFCPAK